MKSGIHVSTDNTFSGSLAGGANFTGVAEDVRAFAEITVNLAGTPSVAPGTLFFEFSPNGTDWDVSVPYTLAGPNSFVPLPLRVVLPFFRVRYVNEGTPLSVFRLTTVMHWQASKNITRVINQIIDENEPVENVRAFIGGKSPDGPFTNVPASGVVTSNSTNTPLGIGGIFTGAVVPTSGFVAASCAVKASHNSAANGIVFSFYADAAGTRLLKTSIFTYGSAPNGTAFQVPVIAGPYMRVAYTNGAAAQASFELLTILSVTAPPSDVLSISETINGNTAAQIVKASIVGQQENGVYANSKLSNSGSQMVAIADRPSEVRGRNRVVIHIPDSTLVVAPGTTLYTVTPGKILYISAFLITQLNSAAAVGTWILGDGATPICTFLMSSRISGSTPEQASVNTPTLPEPLPFTNSIRATEISGDVRIAGFLIGYEE